MKRIILVFVITTMILVGIMVIYDNTFLETRESSENSEITIIATLFPQYDFASKIGGDKVEVKLLLPSGAESHEYEPTAQDYMNVNKADMFVYTGEEMEPWAEKIISSIDKDIKIVNVSDTIELLNEQEDEEHEEERHHEHGSDPHIWLDPRNACIMIDNITNSLIEIDTENMDYYLENAKEYKRQILEIDGQLEDVAKNSDRNKMAFGGTFSYAYFVHRYDLEYISAYDSCVEMADPSTKKIKEVIEYVDDNNIPVIFYPELSNGKVAKMLSEETNAKMLVLSSIHNVTDDEIKMGVSYLSLMKQNLENLKIALN